MLFDCYAETSERAMHDAPIGHFRPDGLASSADDRHLHAGSSPRFAATHHISYWLWQQVRHVNFYFVFFPCFFPDLFFNNKSMSDIDETVWVLFLFFRVEVLMGVRVQTLDQPVKGPLPCQLSWQFLSKLCVHFFFFLSRCYFYLFIYFFEKEPSFKNDCHLWVCFFCWYPHSI